MSDTGPDLTQERRRTGSAVRKLKASYRLRVYEVATGRKLLDKAIGGDDQACPYVVLVGPDRKIYAEVTHRSLLAALRNLVKR